MNRRRLLVSIAGAALLSGAVVAVVVLRSGARTIGLPVSRPSDLVVDAWREKNPPFKVHIEGHVVTRFDSMFSDPKYDKGITATLSDSDLDGFWNVVRDHRFDRIETSIEPTNSRGYAVELSFGGQALSYHRHANTGTGSHVVTPSSRGDYDAVYSAAVSLFDHARQSAVPPPIAVVQPSPPPQPNPTPRVEAAAIPPTPGPAAALTVEFVTALVNAQAASLTNAATAFSDSLSDSAIVFFPHALAPFEGHDHVIEGLRQAWGERGAIADVSTSSVSVGVAGSVVWAATTWTLTGVDKIVMPVRVTEVLVQGSTGPRVVAASFSLPPTSGTTAIAAPVPSFAGGVPAGDGPEFWLASPVELSKRLLDDAMDESTKSAASLFGSDANEKAVGVAEVRKLLLGWKNVKLKIVGNVRVIDGEGYKIVLEYSRWRGPKPTVFRVLGVFIPGTGMVGPAPWQLASAQYSVAVATRAE